MKLLFCSKCYDVVKLQVDDIRYCHCMRSSGRYLSDGWHAEVYGDAEVIGIDNHTVRRALRSLKHGTGDSGGRTLCAWVMGRDAPRVIWKDRE